MTRAELWEQLKKAGITQATHNHVPDDFGLKIVIAHAPISAKALIDFICSLDSKVAVDKFTEKPML